ncbi:MAG: hypothetical protein HKP32_09850 [Woeseia sp.]|nr:hypothetical protein [Woeseia sp.]
MSYRVLLLLVILLFPILSFSAVSVIMLDKSAQQLRDEIPSDEPVDTAFVVAERDAQVVNLDKKQKAGKQMLLVGGAESFVVSLDTGDVVACLVEIRTSRQVRKIRIDGYLIKPSSTMPYVMFPLATALDSGGNVLETLTPLESSRAKGNSIQNYFLLPDETTYLLVHGHPEIVASNSAEVEAKGGAAKALAALGGVIGGVLYGAAQNFQVEKGKASLSAVGVVEIFAE